MPVRQVLGEVALVARWLHPSRLGTAAIPVLARYIRPVEKRKIPSLLMQPEATAWGSDPAQCVRGANCLTACGGDLRWRPQRSSSSARCHPRLAASMRFLFRKTCHWRSFAVSSLNCWVSAKGRSVGRAVWRRAKVAAMAAASVAPSSSDAPCDHRQVEEVLHAAVRLPQHHHGLVFLGDHGVDRIDPQRGGWGSHPAESGKPPSVAPASRHPRSPRRSAGLAACGTDACHQRDAVPP